MVNTKPERCQNMRQLRGGEKRSRSREYWPRVGRRTNAKLFERPKYFLEKDSSVDCEQQEQRR
jgi:hypothetical protein